MNIVEAVFVFGFVSAMFEAVILLKLPIRWRLRLLGSGWAVGITHTLVGIANLIVHFGTVTGTMTAIVASLASFITVPAVRWYCGCIRQQRYYPGVRRYDPQTLG